MFVNVAIAMLITVSFIYIYYVNYFIFLLQTLTSF